MLVGVYVTGLALIAVASAADRATLADAAPVVLLTLPGLWLGLLLVRRRAGNPSGPALIALVDGPLAVDAVGSWSSSAAGPDPLPGAAAAALIDPGVWVFNLAGFVLLCLTFPDGLLPGRLWRVLPGLYLVVAVLVNVVVVLNPANRPAIGDPPGDMPGGPPSAWVAASIAGAVALLVVLGIAVASLIVRYRRGTAVVRQQLRWLVLGASSVPLLLAVGWLAESGGASVAVAYTGFMVAILVVIPVAVTMAILHRDLLDIDRVLAESLSWLLTTLVTAGVFALVALVVSELGGQGGRVATVVGAFLAALVLLPLHRSIYTVVGRTVDRERTRRLATIRAFVRAVRDGEREPEEVASVLAACLNDPALQLLQRAPNATGYTDTAGRPADPAPDLNSIPLMSGESEVGLLLLGPSTPRRRRTAEELAREARLPIEVSRLRLQLRGALDDARAGRARLVEGVAEERRRLERDLHDGAQQQIVAVGMRLRSVQRHLAPDDAPHHELDQAVTALEATVAELRRMAHGIRPGRLDDGLEVAIRSLVGASPIPVEITMEIPEVSEVMATTAYFVVAEGLANTLKHAQAGVASIEVLACGAGLSVELVDDGIGGARPGFGLTALKDRVTALGGQVDIISPTGAGTRIRATF